MSLQDTPSGGESAHRSVWQKKCRKIQSAKWNYRPVCGHCIRGKGTTTDPVKKLWNFLPGAGSWIDTPGMDDDSTLGGQAGGKTRQWWQTVDMALWYWMEAAGIFREKEPLAELRQAHKPYGILVNKEDQMQDEG